MQNLYSYNVNVDIPIVLSESDFENAKNILGVSHLEQSKRTNEFLHVEYARVHAYNLLQSVVPSSTIKTVEFCGINLTRKLHNDN